MSTEAIIAICGAAGTALFFLFIMLPDILKSWQTSKVEAAKAQTEAANAALKRDMVARGFSADEIARVMEAGTSSTASSELSDVA